MGVVLDSDSLPINGVDVYLIDQEILLKTNKDGVFEIDVNMVGYLLTIGIILFSGSLYLIAIYKYSFLGMVAPIGGLCFILGWAVLFYKII